MPTRRELLFSVAGGTIGGVGVYTGMSVLSTGYGSIEWANEREEEVWAETTVLSTGGLFSSPEVKYENRHRIFPTRHYRSGNSNIVKTRTYDVEVEIESKDGARSTGPFTMTWSPADCYHQNLIIRVLKDMSVEFIQKEC
ncbi:hypothetical protein [Halosolutus gelatinilyticus]|uniref:hypothetical protein n=1 Tax=Halosolutus gelatinilyticus TaxID=2931975 RepID=UPI001FF31CDE|nr:hypothetical protein [Halosolutus gelatinilyticus]